MKIFPFYYLSKAGIKIVLFFLIIFILAFLFLYTWWPFLILLLLVLYFFRDSNKYIINPDQNAILSPIQGKIIELNQIEIKDIGKCIEMKINKGFFDKGSLRGIKNADIISIKHKHGLSLCPYMQASKRLNERIIYKLKDKDKFALKIRAGSFSRRLELLSNFSKMQAGMELGFVYDAQICLYLPHNSRLCAQVGERVEQLDLLAYLPYENNAK